MKFSDREIYKQLLRNRFKSRNILKESEIKKDFQSSTPPTIFIGSRLQYPEVNVGVMGSNQINEEVWKYDSPDYWSKENIEKNKIIKYREGFINSRFKANVKDAHKQLSKNSFLEKIQEIGMASIQTDLEIKLKNSPIKKISFSNYHLPIGPSAQLKKLNLTTNTKINPFVEKVYFDAELKSTNAVSYLYQKGLDEHKLSQILSIGVTGLKKNRKLVPTKNSITAIDDNLGRLLIKKIKNNNLIENYKLFFGGHLGNYYIILFLPEIFSYELFELSLDSESKIKEIATDYEDFNGRKYYAEQTGGGYYAARLPIIQYLEKIKRQSNVILIRFTLPSYDVPLGVWVCRNSVRKALENKPIECTTKEDLFKEAEFISNKNFNINIKNILNQSMLLNKLKSQKKLSEWF